ncbi:transcriptional regulator with XRE-family HTH domain [Enterococcus rotai]|uniref:helix-turn-helix domain-containing protein n=1 Tax=Enterococcus rotai TaxID=118060 RepID=UPI00339520DE
MSISSTMKFLRKARGFSQEQAMPKGMTKFSYSKFENDKQSLKAEQIFEILDNIQVTYQEFYTLLNRKNPLNILREKLISYASDPEKIENKTGIIEIFNTLNNKNNLSETEFSTLLDIKGLFGNKFNEIPQIDKNDLKKVKTIINRKKYFTYYDYKLVSNHIMNFDRKDISFFIEAMTPVENIYLRDIETKRVIEQLYINIVTKFMYNNNLNEAKKYLVMAKESNENLKNYYFSIQIQYFDYTLKYLETSETEYLTKLDYLLKIVSDIGDKSAAAIMKEELKVYLEGQSVDVPIGDFPTVLAKDN